MSDAILFALMNISPNFVSSLLATLWALCAILRAQRLRSLLERRRHAA